MEELKRLSAVLVGLLEDPQPGLFTWKEAVSRTLLQLADYAGYGLLSETVKQVNFVPMLKR